MNKFLSNWNGARIIRLLAGVALSIYALTSKEYEFFLLSGLFLLQAALNLSCCGASGCSSGGNNNSTQAYKGEIEEYKPNKK